MGTIFSYFRRERQKKLCMDIIDESDFSIHIQVHSERPAKSYKDLLDHLQITNPVLSYAYCKSIYLLYSPDKKHPYFRSNSVGEIISSITTDITRYCLTYNLCDPYYVEVEVIQESHEVAKAAIMQMIEKHLGYGYFYEN